MPYNILMRCTQQVKERFRFPVSAGYNSFFKYFTQA